MLIPQKIVRGDTIGIVSTSSPTTSDELDHMTLYFEGLGFPVKLGTNVLADSGFLAGSAEGRAADFNAMLHSPSVRMIVTSMGGSGAEHLLPLIDYEAITADPKIIAGLSNPAILLNAITAKTGVPTFHGPNGVEFGHGPLTKFTEDNFWPLVTGEISLPHSYSVQEEMKVVRSGHAVEGPIIGGHLKTIQRLIGTPWAPDWKDTILFLEEYEVVFSDVDKILTHFKLAGILDSIKGLIFGQPVLCEHVLVENLEEVLLRVCAKHHFPIVSNVPIGHTDDKITVPLGCRVKLDPGRRSLELLEAPTR
jgi:muramoyltetrapeptide carboxypeptidase